MSNFDVSISTHADVVLVRILATMSKSLEVLAINVDLDGMRCILNGQMEATFLLEGEAAFTLFLAPSGSLVAVSYNL